MDPGRYRRGDYRCPRVFGGWTSVSQVCDATGVYERLEYQFLSKRQAIIVRRKLRSRETRCGHRWVEFGRRSSSEADGGSTRIRAATSMPNLHLQPMKIVRDTIRARFRPITGAVNGMTARFGNDWTIIYAGNHEKTLPEYSHMSSINSVHRSDDPRYA
ncbi:hypothetical protein LSH36_68g09015 [Paralvinella palmiformis]|uniref:Uncharacterized protein n=1 Tax=Paralvinella palmiformis TaxID=53620 RepID=A0AAD9K405_9ANNE|nr:hypothetical protein LSH36_68g09015 [Paralvinella palmiformis]